MIWIHFLPDETVFFILKFWASLKCEVTPGLGPVDASRNPSLILSIAMDKNSLKKLFRILKWKKKRKIAHHHLQNNCCKNLEGSPKTLTLCQLCLLKHLFWCNQKYSETWLSPTARDCPNLFILSRACNNWESNSLKQIHSNQLTIIICLL